MIWLLHGTDIIHSRFRLKLIKDNYKDGIIQVIAEKNIDYSFFSSLFQTDSLFGEKKLVVVEGKLDITLVNLKVILDSTSAELVVWIDKSLRSNDKLIEQWQKLGGKVESFVEKTDNQIFIFLDKLTARNRKESLVRYNQLLKQDQDSIYILTMIVWQIRMLLFPELAKGNNKTKALQLQKSFSSDELRWIFYQCMQLDIAMKSGETYSEIALEQLIYKITK